MLKIMSKVVTLEVSQFGQAIATVSGPTKVVGCVPSHPAVVGATIREERLVVEVVALPGKGLPATVTVLIA